MCRKITRTCAFPRVTTADIPPVHLPKEGKRTLKHMFRPQMRGFFPPSSEFVQESDLPQPVSRKPLHRGSKPGSSAQAEEEGVAPIQRGCCSWVKEGWYQGRRRACVVHFPLEVVTQKGLNLRTLSSGAFAHWTYFLPRSVGCCSL